MKNTTEHSGTKPKRSVLSDFLAAADLSLTKRSGMHTYTKGRRTDEATPSIMDSFQLVRDTPKNGWWMVPGTSKRSRSQK